MRLILLLAGVCIFAGCAQKEPTAIQIGEVKVTAKEFEEAFQNSPYVYNVATGREEFLESFLHRKVIMDEAERQGLDRDRQLLSDLQSFWETHVLKLMMERKNQEFYTRVQVSAQEIADYFTKHQEGRYANKSLESVANEIRMILRKEKQSRFLRQWVQELLAQRTVQVDRRALGLK